MPDLIAAQVHPTAADTPPPLPGTLRLTDTGRLSPSPTTWRAPLPPLLMDRLPKATRGGHERLVEKWQEAEAQSRAAKLKAANAQDADDAATREAIAAGKRPPQATEPTLRAEAEEAERIRSSYAAMVIENGSALVGSFTDGDLRDAVAEARAEAEGIVEQDLGAAIEQALGVLAQAGELTGQAAWTGRLLDTRRQLAWTGGRRAVGLHASLRGPRSVGARRRRGRHRGRGAPPPRARSPRPHRRPRRRRVARPRARRMTSRELDRLAQHERWTEESMERAAGVRREPPEGETAQERFMRELREQAAVEAREEGRMRRLQAQHPAVAVDDEFRTFATAQLRRRRVRRRGRLPY